MSKLKIIWMLAKQDLTVWIRMPWAVASALIPPFGMALLLVVLTFSVGRQPVALVSLSQGENGLKMQQIIESDEDAYWLTVTSAENAQRMLKSQEVAAIITIPEDFDKKLLDHQAKIDLTLNNVDIDFADDIRRAVDRSAAEFDAPGLGLERELTEENEKKEAGPNPYKIAVLETDLRETNVDFLSYQVIPVFILLILNVGLLGTALLCAQDVERGTAKYLILSPFSSWTLVLGRLFGGVLISLLVLAPVLIICSILKIISPPIDHWLFLITLFLATAVCASGLGAAIGSVVRGVRNSAMVSSIVATYLFFLGGGFTTIVFLPQWLQNISAFVPIRYSIEGMRQALFYSDLHGASWDIGVLIFTSIFAVLIGSLAVRRTWS